MCRWMAYHGAPFLLYDLLFKPEHGIVVQSLKSDMGAEPTNGDGFGVGWYYLGEEPALYRSVEPAWHDRNMKDIVGTVQQTNCHPFKYGKWLWMHNGALRGHDLIKRDLVLRVDPKYFNSIEGTTDSEIFFYLALTFGLEDDVPKAVAKAVGFITQVAKGRGVKYPVMMTVCVTDGSGRMWAFRYSSEGKSRTLFYSTDPPTARALYPNNQLYRQLDDSTRLIVSEPLNELKGLWNAVPESTALFVHGPTIEVTPFEPINHE